MKNSAGFVPNKPKEVLVHGPFPPLWSEARPTKLGGGFTPLEITETCPIVLSGGFPLKVF
ncbi:MAG: hypothetical protein KAI63_04765 [Planctomycetes bacterium]|nr:hypothetical protein [Planctomycetota bacterium]